MRNENPGQGDLTADKKDISKAIRKNLKKHRNEQIIQTIKNNKGVRILVNKLSI